jgi:hypothetical protein
MSALIGFFLSQFATCMVDQEKQITPMRPDQRPRHMSLRYPLAQGISAHHVKNRAGKQANPGPKYLGPQGDTGDPNP